ncbi:hypothetical protein KP509_04G006200 [Ceratopteris richardii]|uniref:C3H1-type domain-containing protein n=1 Tax=Ceratopteris richardii TaxID=49495 RepID=A0A8T2UXB4_CERRI|nr:hypothetical protein KP509_04G006200 [Ceratopteris richardii]
MVFVYIELIIILFILMSLFFTYHLNLIIIPYEVIYNADILSKRARADVSPVLSTYPQRPGEKDCVYYMRTRTCNFGATCKFNHPTWIPAGGIPDWKEASNVETKRQPLPIREGEPDCAFYMKTGICKFGSTCKFNHPENASATASDGKGVDDVNGNLKSAIVEVSTGPAKPAIGFNAKGLPIRSGETDCPFYMKTGSCKFGSVCRFNHPDVAASSVLQQNQTHGASLLGGLSSTYGAYSSFSGSLPNYGVNLSGSEFGLPTLSQTSIYPQRPGEPACSHYIKTGVCKFTSTCKFHHPLDRKDPNVKVTLAGLPRREGEQACPFYMKTGTCKYGLTCKYDHPPPGEAAAKAVAEAGKSETSDADDVQSP